MRAVLIDDFELIREILRTVCGELTIEVAGEAADGPLGSQLIERVLPDLAIIDLCLPGESGISVIGRLRAMRSQVRILVFTAHCNDRTVEDASRVRVEGFVSKADATLAELRTAISAVCQGSRYFCTAFNERRAALHRTSASWPKVLSDREQSVLTGAGDLLTNEQIANRLGVTVAAVSKHLSHINSKLGLTSRCEAVRFAQNHGFVSGIGHG